MRMICVSRNLINDLLKHGWFAEKKKYQAAVLFMRESELDNQGDV